MADTQKLEREYIIPLKREWMKVPSYKRARKAVKTIKQFIAHHMKVTDRDISKVKLDVYLNNELWSRGSRYAPSRVRVKAIRKDGNITVTFADVPAFVAFTKEKAERRHKKAEKKKEEKAEEKPAEAKTEEEKKEESEKEKSAAIVKELAAEQQAKDLKRTTKAKETQIRRMALKK